MAVEKPELRVWKKSDYPEGSVGAVVFPDYLNERERLASPLELPAQRYVLGVKRRGILESENILTVKDLLDTNQEKIFSLLQNQERFRKRLGEQIEGLLGRVAMSPDDKLMGAIFGEYKVENVLTDRPEDEEERGKILREVVLSLTRSKRLRLNGIRVIRRRFGLEDWRAWTLEEVGRDMGVTRERVRQIEALALKSLRYPTRSDLLRPYLPDLPERA